MPLPGIPGSPGDDGPRTQRHSDWEPPKSRTLFRHSRSVEQDVPTRQNPERFPSGKPPSWFFACLPSPWALAFRFRASASDAAERPVTAAAIPPSALSSALRRESPEPSTLASLSNR